MPCRRSGASVIAAPWRFDSRFRFNSVTLPCPVHGGTNSGRQVMTRRIAAWRIRSTISAIVSRVEGSIQCASSQIISTGCRLRQAQRLIDQCGDGQLLVLLRREHARRVAIDRQREQRGEERRDGRQLFGAQSEHGFELVELALGGVVALEAGGAFELFDDRVEGRAAVVRRALVLQPQVRCIGEALAQHLGDAALADAGFAGEQHHLAFAFARLLPAREQQRDLVFAADEGRVATSRGWRRSGSRCGPDRGCAAPAPGRRCP